MKTILIILCAIGLLSFSVCRIADIKPKEDNETIVSDTETDKTDVLPPTDKTDEETAFLPETDTTEPFEEVIKNPSETEKTPETSEPVIAEKSYIRSKVNGLNVRRKPTVSAQSVGSLDAGDMVAFSGEENGWYKTVYLGSVAYVSAQDRYTELVALKKGGERIEKVIALGETLLGSPYVYGATRYLGERGTPQKGFDGTKFDCSSLMQYIFYVGADAVLRETTRTQIRQGQHVEKGDLQRGDLIFMTNASRKSLTGIERVGHVALYLGDNYILHTASDHAVIEPMSATRWAYYIEARRIV